MFIKLTREDGTAVRLNVSHIIQYLERSDGLTGIQLTHGNNACVKEGIAKIDRMLKEVITYD